MLLGWLLFLKWIQAAYDDAVPYTWAGCSHICCSSDGGQVAHAAAALLKGAECNLHAAAAPQMGMLLASLLLFVWGSGPLIELLLLGQEQDT